MNSIKQFNSYIRSMDSRHRKRMLTALGGAVLVLLLAVLPALAAGSQEADGPQASVLSGTVTRVDIIKEIYGGGTLAEEEAQAIRLPAGVKLTEFYVDNYTAVSEGDKLAGVDRISVMSTIRSVQETLDYLKEQLNSTSENTVSVQLSAPAEGRVKAVYVQKGDSVADVMSAHGALAVVSLDGLMAVEFDTKASLSAGDTVWVGFEDGRDVHGRVESAVNGEAVVTVADEGYPIGAMVTVTDSEDDLIGKGPLFVHNAWNAVAYSGTVSAVNVKENTDITAGRTVLSLENVDDSAEFELLSMKHREYEQLMLELFVMYQAEALPAPCDGVVSGVDRNSVHLLSAAGDYGISLLANAPNGDDETGYTNFVGQLDIVQPEQWSVRMNPTPIAVEDYLDLSGVDLNTEAMTEAVNALFDVPVYECVDGAWVQLQIADLRAGDILLFAADGTGGCVWAVRVQRAVTEPVVSPEVSPIPDDTEQEIPMPEHGGMTQQMPAGSFGGGMAAEENMELFDLQGTDILYVTPQHTMTLTVSVDERDVGKLSVGQKGTVAVDVLKGETYTAEITEIAAVGTNNGGSSKYAVELTMERAERMLAGMSATVTFTVETAADVLAVPVAALEEVGGKTVVYTKRSGDTLSNPVTVTTGVSDGERVEILSGLEEGNGFFYTYYDTPEIDNTAK